VAGLHMRRRSGGRIVNLASIAGQRGASVNGVHYAASKAGIVAITRFAASELASSGVTVNAIAPAAIEGPSVAAVPAETVEAMVRTIPVGRLGRPQEVAALVAYLDTLEPPVSAFDQGTLSASARRGEDLFQGKGGCIGCHSGPLLTDNGLHDTLVPKVADGDTDTGAATSGPLKGSFNTPQMRDLRNTGPYMHNGSLKTLREVVEFYDQRSSIAPLRLTDQEIADLVAYLQTL